MTSAYGRHLTKKAEPRGNRDVTNPNAQAQNGCAQPRWLRRLVRHHGLLTYVLVATRFEAAWYANVMCRLSSSIIRKRSMLPTDSCGIEPTTFVMVIINSLS